MKTKLAYKIFAAFLATSFMVVALMVISYRYVVVTSFWDYINQNILGRLDHFTDELASEYQGHQGWGRLKTDGDLWFSLMASALPKDDYGRWSHTPDRGDDPLPQALMKYFQRSEKEVGENFPAGRPINPSFRLVRNLVLFDDHYRYLAGNDASPDAQRCSLRPIVVDHRTVGWLGLLKRQRLADPHLLDFVKAQSLTFYAIGIAILLLAAVVSLMLSRHLLKPIRRLTQGTRDLTTFRFDTRIPVTSKDELGQLARDFNRMADTLKAYETMRQQWITDISHELRTPLAILKGEIEAVQDGVRKIRPETIDSLHSEVMRLSKLVADLHALSLADTQDLQATLSDMHPLDILNEMANHYRGRMEDRGIEMRLELPDASGPVIRGNRDRLAQLFANLFENTLRYTDAPGRLIVSAGQDDAGLTIRFDDSAPGVPRDALERIFERLYRVDSSRNRRLGGSGLGLAICRQIVQAHGGAIRAEASPEGGLGIEIDLPLKDASRQSSGEGE